MKFATYAALIATASATDKKTEVAEIAAGMMEVYGLKGINIGALLACIGAEDKALLVADEAVQTFEDAYKTKNIEEAVGGVIAMVAAYQAAVQGLPACEAVPTEGWKVESFTEDMVKVTNPSSHIAEFHENLTSTFNIEILLELAKVAMDYFHKKDFVLFGRTIGLMVQEIAMKKEQTKALTTTNNSDKKLAVTEMLQGFFKGTEVGTFNFTALLECIYEADQAAEVMYVAIDQIIPEAIHDKQIIEGFVGVFFMVSAVQTFRTQALPLCESVDQLSNWTKFDAMTKNIYPDLKVNGNEIMFNGKDITEEIKSAYESLSDKDYYDFGDKIGSALTQDNMFIF